MTSISLPAGIGTGIRQKYHAIDINNTVVTIYQNKWSPVHNVRVSDPNPHWIRI
jgi:hypothetical protein